MKLATHRFLLTVLIVAAAAFSLLLSACSDDASALYSNIRASWSYNRVLTISSLRSALSNPGQWCRVTFPNATYLFTDAYGHEEPDTPTGQAAYHSPECISGFIIGTPAVPYLSTGSAAVAFDAACPTCYEEGSIQRTLSFSTSSTLYCSRCRHTFDLNNEGVSSDGGKLYRYRIQYNEQTGALVISN